MYSCTLYHTCESNRSNHINVYDATAASPSLPFSFAFLSFRMSFSTVVSSVVPHSFHGPSLLFFIFFWTTIYSTNSFACLRANFSASSSCRGNSLPFASTRISFPPDTFRRTCCRDCSEWMRTTACTTAFRSVFLSPFSPGMRPGLKLTSFEGDRYLCSFHFICVPAVR